MPVSSWGRSDNGGNGCGAIPFSARQPGGPGQSQLADRVASLARGEVRELVLTLPMSDARSINTIEHRGEVLDRAYENGTVRLRARIGSRQLEQLRARGAKMTVESA